MVSYLALNKAVSRRLFR